MNLTIETSIPGKGILALTGSGEFLPGMDEVDSWLLALLHAPAKVVCLPTAAGTEGEERIGYWTKLGLDHFSGLGVKEVESLPVLNHQNAEDVGLAARVKDANFVYFSGGKPAYLLETLQDTPVWSAVLNVLEKGGIVAGCSAGAMIFGTRIPKQLFSGGTQPAFNMLHDVFIMPHFDEIPQIVQKSLPLLAGNLPIIGIEGYTALVCTQNSIEVHGKGSVVLIKSGSRTVYRQTVSKIG